MSSCFADSLLDLTLNSSALLAPAVACAAWQSLGNTHTLSPFDFFADAAAVSAVAASATGAALSTLSPAKSVKPMKTVIENDGEDNLGK